jgi:hypothetical protein
MRRVSADVREALSACRFARADDKKGGLPRRRAALAGSPSIVKPRSGASALARTGSMTVTFIGMSKFGEPVTTSPGHA